jgi:predicted ribosomally synthesized peptide with SipW-like signal peptide
MLRRRLTSKTYLKVLLGVGVLAVVGGSAGTFASFTAETTNANNTFATGTLLLENGVDGGTTCNSGNGSGNAIVTGCSTLFSVPSLSSGAQIKYAKLTLTNTGTLNAGGIEFLASTPCVTQANTPGGPAFATGNLCGALQVQVIETDSSFNHGATVGAYGCAYGQADPNNATTGAGCLFDNAFHLGNLPTTAAGLSLANAVGGNSGTQLTAGKSRYFVIGVSTPGTSGLSNSFQNRKANFDLTWRITQA